MTQYLDRRIVLTLAVRTFRHAIESPVAYVVAILFYGLIGAIFTLPFFSNGQASITDIANIAPWFLWFVVPALTMGLIADELRSGTFEHLATLPLRDWEIVLGKFLGFAMLAFCLIAGLFLYPLVIAPLAQSSLGLDWGATVGILAGLYALSLLYGAIGLFTSSLTKNQVVAFIMGMLICTLFFLLGQFFALFPGFLSRLIDYAGLVSHLNTLARGVWDLRDLFYFSSLTGLFLYLTVVRLSTRRF